MAKKKKPQIKRSMPRGPSKRVKPKRRAAPARVEQPRHRRRGNDGAAQRRRNNSATVRRPNSGASQETELPPANMQIDESATRQVPLPGFSVVGIGASAGGLEAMTQLLAA